MVTDSRRIKPTPPQHREGAAPSPSRPGSFLTVSASAGKDSCALLMLSSECGQMALSFSPG